MKPRQGLPFQNIRLVIGVNDCQLVSVDRFIPGPSGDKFMCKSFEFLNHLQHLSITGLQHVTTHTHGYNRQGMWGDMRKARLLLTVWGFAFHLMWETTHKHCRCLKSRGCSVHKHLQSIGSFFIFIFCQPRICGDITLLWTVKIFAWQKAILPARYCGRNTVL